FGLVPPHLYGTPMNARAVLIRCSLSRGCQEPSTRCSALTQARVLSGSVTSSQPVGFAAGSASRFSPLSETSVSKEGSATTFLSGGGVQGGIVCRGKNKTSPGISVVSVSWFTFISSSTGMPYPLLIRHRVCPLSTRWRGHPPGGGKTASLLSWALPSPAQTGIVNPSNNAEVIRNRL